MKLAFAKVTYLSCSLVFSQLSTRYRTNACTVKLESPSTHYGTVACFFLIFIVSISGHFVCEVFFFLILFLVPMGCLQSCFIVLNDRGCYPVKLITTRFNVMML